MVVCSCVIPATAASGEGCSPLCPTRRGGTAKCYCTLARRHRRGQMRHACRESAGAAPPPPATRAVVGPAHEADDDSVRPAADHPIASPPIIISLFG
eukprot:scaffold4990_cov387-Prasinococcus_capsulatus_cf.AAC.23